MSKRAQFAGLLAALLGIAGTAGAQFDYEEEKRDRRFYLSPMATYSSFDGDRRFDDEVGYQLGIGKILGRGTNVELHGSFVEPTADGGGGNGGELTGYGITFLLFQARDSFPLYGILSINKGLALAEGETEEAISDQFDAGFGYLLGLGRWPLVGKGPALRIEARYRTDKYSQGEAFAYSQQFGTPLQRTFHDGVFGLGLFLPLGGDPNKPAKAEEPAEPTRTIVIAATDSDGDQIPDDQDQCPGTPPGASIDVRGCERDSDQDGVVNSKDQCPGTPTGRTVDADGCLPDGDNDGVLDGEDQCPNSPPGAAVLADGCALSGDCRLPEPGQRIDAQGCAVGAVVLKGVNFASGKAELTGPARQILDEVAVALKGAGGVRVEVGGHTDSQGGEAANQELSRLRAESVKRYLVGRGVAADILETRGYGESEPLAPNDTAEGRAANRRVELQVL